MPRHVPASPAWFCAALLGCGSSGPIVEPPAPPGEPESGLDVSMMPLCERVLRGDRSAETELAAHPLVRKMSEGMAEQVVFTPVEFAAAAFAEEADERFSWDLLRENAATVLPFVESVTRDAASLVAESLAQAGEFVDVELRPADVPVHLVCGGRWDAYVLIFERNEVFFDVGYYGDAPVETAVPTFQAILDHELWHFAFLRHQDEHWPCDYRESEDVVERFFYRVVNEGIGHFYSLRDKLLPEPSIEDLAGRERQTFETLAVRYPEYKAESDPAVREDLLWHSHAGVPFWEKWGALTGAFVVYHLLQDGGAARVASLIAQEPFSLFLAYDESSRERTDRPALPGELVDDARAALERHRERTGPVGADGEPRECSAEAGP
jgi:hypothetical protein